MPDSQSNSEEFVFNGTIVKRDDEHISAQICPGFIVDVRTEDVAELEEDTDPVTQRTYVRMRMNADADIGMNFRPRLARIAAEADNVPFVLGGSPRLGDPVHGMPGGGAGSIPPLVDEFGASLFADASRQMGGSPGALTALSFFTTTNETRLNCPFQTPRKTANSFGFRSPQAEGGFIADVQPTIIDRIDDESLDVLPDTGWFR